MKVLTTKGTIINLDTLITRGTTTTSIGEDPDNSLIQEILIKINGDQDSTTSKVISMKTVITVTETSIIPKEVWIIS